MKKCVVCGRECKQLRKNMCEKHYRQFMKHGKVLDNNPRTKFDPNEIIEYEEYAEIILYNNDCKEIGRGLIDLEDIDIVKKYKWRLNSSGYITSGSDNLAIHRLIINCPDDMVVDHINHNPLDNRKSNLRICTISQNNMNRGLQSNNSSGYVGVSFYKPTNKWVAYIKINSKTIKLGYYDTKEEAIEAREQAEIDLFGEFKYQ